MAAVRNLRNQKTVLRFFPMIMTIEKLKTELKGMPANSLLAIDDLKGGRIPVEDLRFKRIVKEQKPGMSTVSDVVILSDISRLGSPIPMTVEKLRGMLKGMPDDADIVFDNLDGNLIPIEGVRQEAPVQFEKSGTYNQIALVALSRNPWGDSETPAASATN